MQVFTGLRFEVDQASRGLSAIAELSVHSATAAAVVQSRLVPCIISRHFMCDKEFHVDLCPPRNKSMATHHFAGAI